MTHATRTHKISSKVAFSRPHFTTLMIENSRRRTSDASTHERKSYDLGVGNG